MSAAEHPTVGRGSSAIEWTERTWNPVTGCSKVSPGCAHCYAETLSLRFGWSKLPWTPENAQANIVLHPERLEQPLKWRKSAVVFVNSMSDLFHEEIPYEFIREVFNVMRRCDGGIVAATGKPDPSHTFQVLTKRPERALELWQERKLGFRTWPENVWLGTSIENMRWVGRADTLREIPAAVRFISAEPLLGPLAERVYCPTCWDWPDDNCPDCDGLRWWWSQESLDLTDIDWLIVGGESGPVHRPMKPEWVRELRDMARLADTAFFFKQWGGRTPKAGGRELDGRTWDEMPHLAAERGGPA